MYAFFLDEMIRKSLCWSRFVKAWLFVKFRNLWTVSHKIGFLSEYKCKCQTLFLTAWAGEYWTYSRPFNRSLGDIFAETNQPCGCSYICKFSWLYWNWSWKKYVIWRNSAAVSPTGWAVKTYYLGIYLKNFQWSRHIKLNIFFFLLVGKSLLGNLSYATF